MQKWEYKVIICKKEPHFFKTEEWDKDIELMLPELGEEGWELINVIPESTNWGENRSGLTSEEKWIFKRLK
ncbi:DUF4177 domain-containing protein [Clostridium sp. JS66]|uniref:DUF4177 domain-containing protein n=1 Tax=Clostridium sp. JS66 TaxID=3064705 RepID=UPI00298D6028|nr:DUF4177 domain-containing protein [Clostridium sp. JS66]WPC43923.1 DUF4177 domain-containing protein [Clostridium sp. JS66]